MNFRPNPDTPPRRQPISFRIKPWGVRTTHTNNQSTVNYFYCRGDAEAFCTFMSRTLPGTTNIVFWDETDG